MDKGAKGSQGLLGLDPGMAEFLGREMLLIVPAIWLVPMLCCL